MKIVTANSLPENFFAYQDIEVSAYVKDIIEDVRRRGDAAIREYTQQFDGTTLDALRVPLPDLEAAVQEVETEALQAIQQAAENIRKFAEVQKLQFRDFEIELSGGVKTGQRVIPIQRAGIYVPGGSFPLVSSLLMGAIPAQVAGVTEMMVCSPPTHQNRIAPVILAAAALLGIEEVYQIGGVQAIAAMAYGSKSVKAVDKIVGPGNKYVAQAKREVFGTVGIDLIAGPTEVLILADTSADPEILAADLLAQAEHDIDATPILLTTSTELAAAVDALIPSQLKELQTEETASVSIEERGMIILVDTISEAIDIINRKAPEHLELQIKNPEEWLPELKNFGALFIGESTAEVFGDYNSGVNHTLPTNTTARYRGGLSVQDFLKLHTTLQVDDNGLRKIGPAAAALARAEGLDAHEKSVMLRLQRLERE